MTYAKCHVIPTKALLVLLYHSNQGVCVVVLRLKRP